MRVVGTGGQLRCNPPCFLNQARVHLPVCLQSALRDSQHRQLLPAHPFTRRGTVKTLCMVEFGMYVSTASTTLERLVCGCDKDEEVVFFRPQ